MSSDPTEAAKSPATNIPAVIKVAIIEDQRDIREGLAWIIRATEGFDCTGAFRSVEEAVEKIGFDLPHVVLTDIGLPGMSGVEGIRILKERHPKLLLLMLTVYEDDEMIFDALCAGACGYLLKKTSPTRLIESLREAMGGGAPMSPEVASRVIKLLIGAEPAEGDQIERRQSQGEAYAVRPFDLKPTADWALR